MHPSQASISRPSFGIYGQLDAEIDGDLSVAVDLAYTADHARVYFPAEPRSASSGAVNTGGSKLSLSVAPNFSTRSKVTAHLIPEVKLALHAFTFIKADVYLNADASATLALNLTASGSAGVEIVKTPASAKLAAPAALPTSAKPGSLKSLSRSVNPKQVQALTSKAPVVTVTPSANRLHSSASGSGVAHARLASAIRGKARAVTPIAKAEGQVSGGVKIGAAFSINVGANANFFGLIDASKKYALFSHDWTLYEKQFAASGAASTPTKSHPRRTIEPISERAPKVLSMNLKCPALMAKDLTGGLEKVIEGIFSPKKTSK
ncbi:hypothetical protein MIND_01272800 [Mycena indigotica]|uniref:Uncharacterized protein n=1 Tax=Mycena indigotica TaxID=2126181 RepID=A0A8H6S1P0_9AGAR|nr:uncharacterized protein MIND_01272800 [Mycena indigotica]KAF7291289.1 hypothetical protein MIND_01272800 [Mycena indigotica]